MEEPHGKTLYLQTLAADAIKSNALRLGDQIKRGCFLVFVDSDKDIMEFVECPAIDVVQCPLPWYFAV
jgi:hypothetical protein